MKQQCDGRTYCKIVEYIEELSAQINDIYNIQPKVFLRFNQNNEIGGSTIPAYRISDMYIELDIPHNYTFGKKRRAILACMLIHEYCHYIESLSISGKERIDSVTKYIDDQKYRCADEQRNWTATKRLAKRLGLWSKLFYDVTCTHYYTTLLHF